MDGPPRCNTCHVLLALAWLGPCSAPGLSNDRGVQQPAPVRGIPGCNWAPWGDRGGVLQQPVSLPCQLRSLLFCGCTADPIEDGGMHAAPAGKRRVLEIGSIVSCHFMVISENWLLIAKGVLRTSYRPFVSPSSFLPLVVPESLYETQHSPHLERNANIQS
jgi:hypothetical protein